jgi:hypothetical protein
MQTSHIPLIAKLILAIGVDRYSDKPYNQLAVAIAPYAGTTFHDQLAEIIRQRYNISTFLDAKFCIDFCKAYKQYYDMVQLTAKTYMECGL